MILELLINAIQVWLYLPFYLSLLDNSRLRTLEGVATSAALALNILAIFKKTCIVILHLPFLWGSQADALFRVADMFLVIYFFTVYVPSFVTQWIHARQSKK